MSIASRIEAIEQHLTDDYSVLELAGADLTNVDKNIFNLKQSWEERLLYFLANGTDVVWNNWLPKINGTGETITLNNTIEAKMDFVYKGNTSQKTTTGKNLFNSIYYKNKEIYTETISISTGNLYCTKLYLKPNTTYTISEALNNWSLDGGWIFVVADTNNQIIRFLQNRTQDYQTNPTTFTTNSEGYVYIGHRYGFTNGGADRAIAFLNTVNIQIEEGNTATSFEEYTGGNPAPNPDYPQDIQVVSGDNSIKVEGKNLFQTPNTQTLNGITLTKNTDGTFNLSGTATANTNMYLAVNLNDTKIQNGTYTISRKSTGYNTQIDFYNGNSWLATSIYVYGNNLKATSNITIPNNATMVRFIIYVSNGTTINLTNEYVQLEKGSTSTTFQPYQSASYPVNLGNIELCKIGDYQDSIKKSTGKNLFDKDNVVGGFVNADGSVGGDTNAYRTSNFIPIQPNTAYYKTSTESPRTKYYDSNKQPLNTTTYQDILIGGNAGTFTTPNNAYYLRFSYPVSSVNANSIMINEGSTALPYEPYGKVWYLNKQIGKVVLDGSESGWHTSSLSVTGYKSYYVESSIRINQDATGNKCNYFEYKTFNEWQSLLQATFIENSYQAIGIRVVETLAPTLEDFKTWLSTHNTIAYFVLATPTITEITDSTLIYQLEATKKSYNNQTNISQENSKEAFILDVTALGN